MAQQTSWRAWLPHGVAEQTGVLIWLISVLLIGLRVTITLTDDPAFVNMLRFSITALYSLAAFVGVVGSLVTFALRRRTSVPTSRFQLRLRVMRVLILTVECLIAATVVRAAIALAQQAGIPWLIMGQLMVIAAAHIALTVLLEKVGTQTPIRIMRHR